MMEYLEHVATEHESPGGIYNPHPQVRNMAMEKDVTSLDAVINSLPYMLNPTARGSDGEIR